MSSKKAIERCRAQRPAQDPQRPGSRLRKNAAAAARDAVARGATQYAELVELQKVERRRVERIERDGISVNDIALVCGLAQGMTGGIGPKGIAMRFEKVIPTISRELRALLHLAERAKARATACRKERARRDRRGGRIQCGSAPARRGRRR